MSEPKSAAELLQEIEAKYGKEAETRMTYEEAKLAHDQAIEWGSSHDLPVQDFIAENCFYDIKHTEDGEIEEASYVAKLLESLRAVDGHLRRGKELGLSEQEQTVIDSLFGGVPHGYLDNYVACARELSAFITKTLPPPGSRDREAFIKFFKSVRAETLSLAKKHDVYISTDGYSLSLGYLEVWLKDFFDLKKK